MLSIFLLFFIIPFMYGYGTLGAVEFLSHIPDNFRVRQEMMELIEAPLYELTSGKNQIVQDPLVGFRVRMRIDSQPERGYTYVIFENEHSPSGNPLDIGTFPLIGAGNYIVRRTHETGEIDQIKIFLGQGPHVFLRISPLGEKSRASFFAYNDQEPLFSGILLPLSALRIISMPTSELLALLSGTIKWEDYLPPKEHFEYQPVEEMVSILRPRLKDLPDAEDGAMDENGRLVQIESLSSTGLPGFNCSGFAKWVADGLYQSLTGGYLPISALKQKHLDLRGSALALEFEDLRDPYFGLDWTRNIASSVNSAYYGGRFHPEDSDVRDVPFFEYIEDIGYEVSDLWQIMYFLALNEPGNWYLGSINGEFGSSPVLWQHYHVVVLFPYFDESGAFRVVVMERNLETGVDSLIKRYPKEFIHLVKILAADIEYYSPPKIEY
jgi:hypothetical protein